MNMLVPSHASASHALLRARASSLRSPSSPSTLMCARTMQSRLRQSHHRSSPSTPIRALPSLTHLHSPARSGSVPANAGSHSRAAHTSSSSASSASTAATAASNPPVASSTLARALVSSTSTTPPSSALARLGGLSPPPGPAGAPGRHSRGVGGATTSVAPATSPRRIRSTIAREGGTRAGQTHVPRGNTSPAPPCAPAPAPTTPRSPRTAPAPASPRARAPPTISSAIGI